MGDSRPKLWTARRLGGTNCGIMRVRTSERVQRLAPSATVAMAERARVLREQGADVLAFAAGQPDFDTAEPIKQAAARALSAGDTKYPPPAGKPELRQAVCAYLSQWCGLAYEPRQVCITPGAKDALALAFAALLDPGDEVLVPVPYWVSYPEQVRLFDGRPVFIEPRADGSLRLDPQALEAACTPRTRVLVLNSPCNPSGVVYRRDELEAIAEVVRRRDLFVISDEIYHRLVYEGAEFVSFAALDGMAGRTLTVNGVSKSFAMTGWRLGFAAGEQPVIDAMVRLQGQTTGGPASFVQTAAIEALTGDQSAVEQMREAYQRRRRLMCDGLRALPGVQCREPGGAFYVFADVRGTFNRLGVSDADGFAFKLLDEAHVAVVSGSAFGMPTHVRLSFACSDEQIIAGLERIGRWLEAQ